MTPDKQTVSDDGSARPRLKKAERRRQILLELKLHPHVRNSELSYRFGVSTETIRRDLETLSRDGVISRAHGGASTPTRGHYPSLDERESSRVTERERIGRRAAELVEDGETLMIDSGATTIQLARSLAYLGTQCTVITNSIPVAMTLGHGAIEVLLCPGEYVPAESAVVGTETIEFLQKMHVDRCMMGASGISVDGPSETVRGFASVKRAMLKHSDSTHLLIDREKFGRRGLTQIGGFEEFRSVIVDQTPQVDLLSAMKSAGLEVHLAS